MSGEPTQHTFPAAHGLQLVELARRWGVEADSVLGPFGLDESQLARTGARLDADTLVALTERVRDLTGEPGICIYLGLSKQITAYGFGGFAAMSAATLREALEQTVEFTPTVTTSLSLSLRVEGETAALVLTEHLVLTSIRDIALLSFFVGLRHMTRDLMGREPALDVELAIAEPPYFSRFTEVLPSVRFGQPLNRMIFRADALDLPLARPDRAAFNLAREQCQRQMTELGFAGSWPGQVRRAITADGGFANIAQVARHLHVSERTLKRRLTEAGVSFSELARDERRLRAMHLLRASELSIGEIAEALDYSTTGNFTRAFTAWTGRTPAAYRREVPREGLLRGAVDEGEG